MDQKQIYKQMVDYQRGAFNSAYDAVVMVQDQTEALADAMLSQVTWLPEEGKKAIEEWVAVFKKGREAYKQTVDDTFKTAESLF